MVYKLLPFSLLIMLISFSSFGQSTNHSIGLPGGNDKWKLVWQDDFNYPNNQLDKEWEAQNGSNNHILCSRWRENAVVGDGTLKLVNKKEKRGGQDWTSASIWTKKKFQYGYFECRYKYAAANATNNSFWLMTQGGEPTEGKRFEIDINEGHYPNEVATNIHNWSDIFMVGDKKSHHSYSQGFQFGNKPDYTVQLEIPITAQKIRLTSNNSKHFHLDELRVYGVNEKGYPKALSETADNDVSGLVNFMRDKNTKIEVSGCFKEGETYQKENIADGKLAAHWVTQSTGEKWVEVTFNEPKKIGCVQIINGYKDKGNWTGFMSDYKLQYFDGKNWVDMSTFDINNGNYNFSKEYHVYGLDWSKEELVFYFDGKEIRRVKNDFCYSPSPVWLSEAIISWSGSIKEEQLNGSAMEVDYVRVYEKKN